MLKTELHCFLFYYNLLASSTKLQESALTVLSCIHLSLMTHEALFRGDDIVMG